jgi:hypothetical protein
MVLAHKHGWHHMKTSYPMDPSNNTVDTLLRCHWCGLSVVTEKRTVVQCTENNPQCADRIV